MTKHYFIDKFTAIPDDQWTIERFTDDQGRHCALGFCGAPTRTEEYQCLSQMFVDAGVYISFINDGKDSRYQQHTPKARVLAALNDLP